MADAAAARREARRRKILENSHNRLQRISGKSEAEIPKESSLQALISEETCEILPAPVFGSLTSTSVTLTTNSPLNNGVVVSNSPSVNLSTSNLSFEADVSTSNRSFEADVSTPNPSFEADAAGDGLAEVANDLAAFMSSTSPPVEAQQATHWEKLILYKYDVVLVSLLVQLLYSFSMLTFNETYFFLPLVVYVVTKMMWFSAPSSSNFANALLLLNGISVQRVERILSVMRWVPANYLSKEGEYASAHVYLLRKTVTAQSRFNA